MLSKSWIGSMLAKGFHGYTEVDMEDETPVPRLWRPNEDEAVTFIRKVIVSLWRQKGPTQVNLHLVAVKVDEVLAEEQLSLGTEQALQDFFVTALKVLMERQTITIDGLSELQEDLQTSWDMSVAPGHAVTIANQFRSQSSVSV